MEDRQSLMWNRFYIFPCALGVLSGLSKFTAKFAISAKDFDKTRVPIKYLCVPSGLCGKTITAKLAMSAKRYYNLQFFML